jgi:hypothetical protein
MSFSNDPKNKKDSPGPSPGSTSSGEPPPPKKPESASAPEAGKELRKEHLEQVRDNQRAQHLAERQNSMAADVQKQKGDSQSQQPAQQPTPTQNPGDKSR